MVLVIIPVVLFILGPGFFPIKDFMDVGAYFLIFVFYLIPLTLIIFFIFMFIIYLLYPKVYNFFQSKTAIHDTFKKLELINKPYDNAVRKEIDNYIKNDYKELLQRTKEPSFKEDAKLEFIENYSFLKELNDCAIYIFIDTAIEYVPNLKDFLNKSKSIIKEFYDEIDSEYDNEKDTKKPDVIKNETLSYIQEEPQDNPINNTNDNNDHILSNINNIRKLFIKSTKVLTEKKKTKIIERRRKVQLKKINWEQLSNYKNNIGLCGEELVLLSEKNKLIKYEMYEYLTRIEHVSQTRGDGLGYDIISFDREGNQIFIEVKSTNKDLKSDIFFTSNELLQMESLGNNYYLYRVYDLNLESKSCEIEIFRGTDSVKEYFEFFTESVRAKMKKEKKSKKSI